MKLKCVITDDEPVARKGIKGYIEKTDFLSLAGECETAMELNSFLKKESVDVIFLDVEMPGLTGMEFLGSAANLPKIIIVSAYERYALKGYEMNVFDYLLKPVSYDRFLKSVNRLYDQQVKELKSDDKDHIFIKVDKKNKKLKFEEILFIESMENYVLIHTVVSKEMVYCTLKMMSDNLPAAIFLQVHRSFIVNISQVQSIEGNSLEIKKHKIPISRSLKDEVYNKLTAGTFVTGKKR
ncbi:MULTISPECIES: LytR/AlgR family response regulator transcription factor [Flavobacterium]|uniref:LytR/AlgR family response regulator transcription factor n=1 Tax=Flavobacterium TaxID=237 RepID=UPI001183B6B1|nr:MULTISPECIES: LytTR family DNA-binding domain-containing protein [Flavobacterium]MCR4032160.1 LytTR family DNA-binding domain-containing protein [Flavobacterium panacis]